MSRIGIAGTLAIVALGIVSFAQPIDAQETRSSVLNQLAEEGAYTRVTLIGGMQHTGRITHVLNSEFGLGDVTLRIDDVVRIERRRASKHGAAAVIGGVVGLALGALPPIAFCDQQCWDKHATQRTVAFTLVGAGAGALINGLFATGNQWTEVWP